MVSTVTDTSYRYWDFLHSFPLGPGSSWAEVFVKWAGTDSLWVDYVLDYDDDGLVLASGDFDDEIMQFVQDWAFNDNPSVIGFFLGEERYEDANVIPQMKVDNLIKAENSRLQGFTEHHYLYKWSNTPGNPYGGRSAASARLQSQTHISTISYPITGYNPYLPVVRPTGPGYDTSLACLASPPPTCDDVYSDTSICFQSMMDKAGQYLRFWRRFCQELDPRPKFVPHMQAFSLQSRKIPESCTDDTLWYGSWRRPAENEVKCHAGVALANGVNGLLYFKYSGSIDSIKIKLQCHEDSVYYRYREYTGLVFLPEVQADLRDWVGPFVDSLGHFFADFNWIGGGRVDPQSDSAGLVDMFDSVKSLTFTDSDDSAYVEAGVYELDGDNYFLLANRRAYDSVPQEIQTWLVLDSALYYVVDMFSYDTILVGPLPGGEIPFTTSIDPGESKLFKVKPAGISHVAGSQFPAKWQGGIPLGGSVTVDSGRTLTILPPARITVPADSNYSIDVAGSLVARGTTTDSIKFVSTAAQSNDWFGIHHYGLDSLWLYYCEVAHSYKGVWIDDSGTGGDIVIIGHSNFHDHANRGIDILTEDTARYIAIAGCSFTRCGAGGVRVLGGNVITGANEFSDPGNVGILYGNTTGALCDGSIWGRQATAASTFSSARTVTLGTIVAFRTLSTMRTLQTFTLWAITGQVYPKATRDPMETAATR